MFNLASATSHHIHHHILNNSVHRKVALCCLRHVNSATATTKAPQRLFSRSAAIRKSEQQFDPVSYNIKKRMVEKSTVPPPPEVGRVPGAVPAQRIPALDKLLGRLLSKENIRKQTYRVMMLLFFSALGLWVADKRLGLVSEEEKGLRKHFMQGNKLMQAHKYEEAIKEYNLALGYYVDATVFYNRSLAFLEIDNVQQALFDCNVAIELDPKYEKAFVRRAVIKHGVGDLKGAIDDLFQALDLIALRESQEAGLTSDSGASGANTNTASQSSGPKDEKETSYSHSFSIETAGKFTKKMLGLDKIVLSVRGANTEEVKALAKKYVAELKEKADSNMEQFPQGK